MADLDFRGHYRPSGRIDMSRFVPLGAGVLGAAATSAWLLWLGFESRFYSPLIFTLGASMIVGSLGLLAVRLGHCRSPAAALLLGLTAGLIVQPGHHLLPYFSELGPEQVPAPADFLRYLDQRLASVKMDWSVPPKLADDGEISPSRGDYFFLWAATLLEVIFVPLMCGLPPLMRVLRRPYCEHGGEWAERHRIAFLPVAEDALRKALVGGRIAELAPALVVEHHPNHPALLGLLDVCSSPSPDGITGYFSLRRSRGEPASAASMRALWPYYRLRVRCSALSGREVEELRALTSEQATARVTQPWSPAVFDDLSPHRELARLETVDQADPPAIDLGTRRFAELLGLVPLLVFCLVGIGLLFAAVKVEETHGRLAASLGISGFALMGVGIWIALMDLNLLGDRYLLHKVSRRLAQRPGVRVKPGDDDALSVALVPRRAWSGDGNEHIDHGFLAIRDSVIYEGDRLRFSIPAASIHHLYEESLTIDQYQTWRFAMLSVEAKDGLHTLPFTRIAAPLRETLFRSKKRRHRVFFDHIKDFLEEHGTAWNAE